MASFGIPVGSIFSSGVRGYRENFVPLTAASLATLGVYALFRVPAQDLYDQDRIYESVSIDLVGLIVSGTLAHPWYRFALDAADGRRSDPRDVLGSLERFGQQAVASFWFWAGILLGFRYLAGIPSILVLLFYAFYGFVIADGRAEGGLKALGTSVRLGEGRRIGLFALGGLFLVFNLFGAIAVGYGVSPLTLVLAVLGLSVTTNITMVAGANIYRHLLNDPVTTKKRARAR